MILMMVIDGRRIEYVGRGRKQREFLFQSGKRRKVWIVIL